MDMDIQQYGYDLESLSADKPSSGRGNEKDVCELEKVLDWPLFSALPHER